VPKAEVHLLEAGHFALDEATDEIASLVLDFLDRLATNKKLKRGTMVDALSTFDPTSTANPGRRWNTKMRKILIFVAIFAIVLIVLIQFAPSFLFSK
jgi:hypothetical protein